MSHLTELFTCRKNVWKINSSQSNQYKVFSSEKTFNYLKPNRTLQGQPHLGYACTTCFPNFSKNWKAKFKLQKIINSICFSVQLHKMLHLSQKEFDTINCLPIKGRCHWCINFTVFKYFDNQCFHYLNEVFIKG